MPNSLKEWLYSLGLGCSSALVAPLGVALSTVHPILFLVALLFGFPLYYAYLSKGNRIGGFSVLFGCLVTLAWGSTFFLVFYGVTALTAFFFCQKALLYTQGSFQDNGGRSENAEGDSRLLEKRIYYPEALLLQNFSLLCLGLCLAVTLVFQSVDPKEMKGFVDHMNAQLLSLSPEGEPFPLETFLDFIPSILTLYWALLQVVSAVTAQKLAKKQGHFQRPDITLETIHLKDFWFYALALQGIFVLVLQEPWRALLMNTLLVTLLPFWVVGLGICSGYVRHRFENPLKKEDSIEKFPTASTDSKASLVMGGIYVLIFLIPLAHLIIVALGIFKPWLGVRGQEQSSPFE